MKIIHICLASIYADNYSYQENLLPKFHKKMGFDVEIVASLATFNKDGKKDVYNCMLQYINEYGIKVTRLKYLRPIIICKSLRLYQGLFRSLEEAVPDIIFIHGCQFLDINKIVRYVKKHKKVRIYVDNHADFKNSARNWLSRTIKHGVLWKHSAKIIEPFTSKFYGVLPARVNFLKNVYKLPKNKCELLPLGADDEIVKIALNPEIKAKKRYEYSLSDNDFVIVTGGKIDYNKPQTLKLMGAVNRIEDNNIKLIVFGTVTDELKEKFHVEISDKVKYVGWKKSEDIYSEFATADIVAFPGLHSVLWEQAVGMGKPCIFKKIEGFQHIDIGGNCLYFERDNIEHYIEVIKNAIENIERMKIAASNGLKKFSYLEIAKKSIESK